MFTECQWNNNTDHIEYSKILVNFIRNPVQEDNLALLHFKEMQESKIKTRVPKHINDQVIKHDDDNPKHKDWKWNKKLRLRTKILGELTVAETLFKGRK